MHDRIISFFIDVSVPSQESERSCIGVLGISSQESERSCICVLGVSVLSHCTNTPIHDRSLSWLGTDTSIKNEMMRSCICFPQFIQLQHFDEVSVFIIDPTKVNRQGTKSEDDML
jgi:hypothetical protein